MPEIILSTKCFKQVPTICAHGKGRLGRGAIAPPWIFKFIWQTFFFSLDFEKNKVKFTLIKRFKIIKRERSKRDLPGSFVPWEIIFSSIFLLTFMCLISLFYDRCNGTPLPPWWKNFINCFNYSFWKMC